MLQILLAFLAISIISVSGYGLVEQLGLQQVMVDQRENMRRLDVAADAIQARLVSMPGREGVFAPAPLELSSGWSSMPAGLGGINATVDGVPFLYCPVSPVDGTGAGRVSSPDGSSYGVDIQGGVVVASHLTAGDASGQQQLDAVVGSYRPVAFIVAAGRSRSTPPSCGAIRTRNGRPFVVGGLVKIVANPLNPGLAGGVGTIAASTSDIYVSPDGGGSGRQGDPASLDDALSHWVKFRPAEMAIHLTGDVSVRNAGVWNSFVVAMGASSGRLTIDGAGHSVSAPPTQVSTPGTLTLSSVSLVGPTLVVSEGDQLSTVGDVGLVPGGAGSTLYVQPGARLNVGNGTLRMSGASNGGVESAGEVVVTGGSIVGVGKAWSIALTNGGRLSSVRATIGDASQRNSVAGLMVAGASSVTTDNASSVVAAASGQCWSSFSETDVTFRYSDNGPGSSSAVGVDPGSPPLAGSPPTDAEVQAYQEYRRQVDGRQRARQTNHSSFRCI